MPTLPRVHKFLHVLVSLAVVAAVAAAGPPAGAGTPAEGLRPATGPPLGADSREAKIIWGATARPRGAEDWIQAVKHLEAKVDRQLTATRVYMLWDSSFPNDLSTWLADTGHLPLISVNSRRWDGTPVLWRNIANAQPGSTLHSQIVQWADRIKAYGVPVYFTFNHEPEAAASDPNGTDQEFIAAWRKVVNVFRSRGVTNAKYLWIMTGWAFAVDSSDHRHASKWYPGDSYVDAIGSDEYNDYTCRTESDYPWRSLRSEIEPFRRFGLRHPDVELWLPEFGSFEDRSADGRKGKWMRHVRATFKRPGYGQFRGIVYFHSYRVGTPCEWWVDSSKRSLRAFRAMGQDRFYSRHYQPDPG